MARSGGLRSVLGHPGFLATFLMAFAAFFSSFVGQIILESKYQAEGKSGSAVGVQWFAIFYQLVMIVWVFITLASDGVARNRFQVSIFLAIAVVFAVLGTNSGIFNDTSFQLAIGAGWLISAVVDLLWLLYFTSEEGTFFVNLFDSRSRGGFSRGTINQQRGSNHRASMANGGAAVSYSNAQYSGVKGGLGGGPAGMSVGDLSGAGHAEEGGHSPNMGGTSLMDGQGGQPEYLLKARALYSYSASPDDPNEISFAKGEILSVVDNSGKWWQARKSDGTTGIIPSNYVVVDPASN